MGRPKQPAIRRGVRVFLTIRERTLAEECAAELGISLSEYTRDALREKREREEEGS